jgi:hypothetical protein
VNLPMIDITTLSKAQSLRNQCMVSIGFANLPALYACWVAWRA